MNTSSSVSEGGKCPVCRGSWMAYTAPRTVGYENCETCKGTGLAPSISETKEDEVLKELDEYHFPEALPAPSDAGATKNSRVAHDIITIVNQWHNESEVKACLDKNYPESDAGAEGKTLIWRMRGARGNDSHEAYANGFWYMRSKFDEGESWQFQVTCPDGTCFQDTSGVTEEYAIRACEKHHASLEAVAKAAVDTDAHYTAMQTMESIYEDAKLRNPGPLAHLMGLSAVAGKSAAIAIVATEKSCIEVGRKIVEEKDAEISILQNKLQIAKRDSQRLKWLHTGGQRHGDNWEWGVAEIQFDARGQVINALWGNSDSSDIDAAMEAEAALASPDKEGGV